MSRSLLALAVLLALAPLARAGGVHVLGKPELGVFTTLQGAVDAAVDGDVLLAAPGTYGGFTIDGKGVSVFTASVGEVLVTQPVVVRNVPAQSGVVLSGLKISVPDQSMAPPALLVEQCQGLVRLQGCSITGGGKSSPGGASGWGVRTYLASRVAIVDCVLRGGSAVTGTGADGGAALSSQASAIALYDSFVRGGRGGNAVQIGGAGGHGVDLLNFGIVAVGCDIAGGDGGSAVSGGSGALGGDGGHGLRIQLAGQAQLVDVASSGGAGGVDFGGLGSPGTAGQPITGGGAVVQHPIGARRFTAAQRVAGDGAGIDVTVVGAPGDLVFAASAMRPGWRVPLPVTGVWLVPYPFHVPAAPLAVVPASGTISVKLFGQDVAGATGRIAYAQGFVVTAQGELVIASPLVALLLDRQAQPDCNGNGVLDLVDALEGTSADCDANLLPDECPGYGRTLHVDPAAPLGGDGSAAHPYKTLRAAFDVAHNWDTLLLRDGVYQGAANRNLDFECRSLTVRSANGPDACILDLSSGPRAFLLQSGEGRDARIEGLTIRNAPYVTGPPFLGGGVRTIDSSPTIVGCVFRDNEVNATGGALHVSGGAPLVEDCQFQSNISAFTLSHSAGVVRRCTFLGNRGASNGSALSVVVGSSTPGTGPHVSHCTFVGNGPGIQGGALYLSLGLGAPEPLVVSECLFYGNSAHHGGAVSLRWPNSTGPLARLVGCTFSQNSASQSGGAVECNKTELELLDSIFWANGAPDGAQIALRSGSQVLVRSSNVQGGEAAVYVASGTLQWGPGNLDVDPLFLDPPLDFRLAPGSPCIDAGDNSLVALDHGDIDGDGITNEPVPFDLDLLPRFVDDPLVPDTGSGTPPLVDMGAYERQP